MSDATSPAPRRGLADTLELDKRLFGMIIAFAILCIGFQIQTGGTFLSARNIFHISVQTVSVGIMATGMVFVIVARHIDPSVGSMLATCSAIMAMLQTQWLVPVSGLGTAATLVLSILIGLGAGTAIGAITGWMVGYQRIPSFIVTLGGLLIWRNLAWYTTNGLPISVLILAAVAVTMTVIARKTRLGRYIHAIGGNPDAAELSGINTRAMTVKIFALMGFLCGLAGLVAQARLQSHGNDIGTLDELKVIAATVIGGTALAGGVGTIAGALLGALVMQSLQSGMAMIGVDTPFQNIVVGGVLIVAVWIDIFYRKRLGELK